MNLSLPAQDKTLQSLVVQITEACNLRCPYCFAKESGEGEQECIPSQYMSEDDFDFFLDFCVRNEVRMVRLTGGETLLHPLAPSFIGKAIRAGRKVHVFSNFTVEKSVESIQVPGEFLSFLVNVNDRESYSVQDWQHLLDNMRSAVLQGYRFVLGYTVHTLPFRSTHLSQLALEFGIKKIRISPAKPIVGGNNLCLDSGQMRAFAEKSYAFARELRGLGIRLMLDCPLPICHIPEEYRQFFAQALNLNGNCNFGLSVDVKLDVGHCYITNALIKKQNLRTFNSCAELAGFLARTVSELEELCPRLAACDGCHFDKVGLCRSGCYGERHLSTHNQ